MANSFEPNIELSELLTRLWELDENRAEPGEDYEIDIQGYVKNAREVGPDWAQYKLFTWLNEEKLFEKETYKAFRALLDNYEADTSKREEVTEHEENENRAFIDALMDTAVMQEAHSFLVGKEKAPEDVDEFKILLYDIWFKLYKRTMKERVLNSSSFEHVFVGEVRGEDVIGFHNWLQLYLQEKRGNVDYKGYFRRGTADEEFPRLMTLQFSWKGDKGKPIGSSFIGTSPEFEVAMYTVCHLLDCGQRMPVTIADYNVVLHVYKHRFGIGTAYPVAK